MATGFILCDVGTENLYVLCTLILFWLTRKLIIYLLAFTEETVESELGG